MNNICTKQNDEINISLLKAQRRLYSGAKKLSVVNLIISAPLIILFGVVTSFFPELQVWYSLFSLIVIFLNILLKKQVEELRTDAARIQSKFDENVLEIKTNHYLTGDTIAYEAIKYNADRISKKDSQDLTDWYPQATKDLPIPYARLICQRANCYWNFAQRKFLLLLFKLIAWSSLIVVIIIGVLMSSTLKDVLLLIVLPCIPIIQWATEEITDHKNALEMLKNLKENFDDLISDILNKKISSEELLIASTQIQDAIFIRRSLDPLVPNFLYWLLRKDFEPDMQFSADQLAQEIKKVI
jgi:low affinity Fe/Cu permease